MPYAYEGLCKISAQPVQQFPRKLVTNKQIDLAYYNIDVIVYLLSTNTISPIVKLLLEIRRGNIDRLQRL